MKLLQADHEVAPTIRPAAIPAALYDARNLKSKGSARSSKAGTGFDIFQWMSTDAQQDFSLASRRRRFADNCRIYSQSDPGTDMYRILSGSVRMSVLRHDGREALHSLLEAGDCFGICSMLDGAPRHHTTTANGNVEVQVLGHDACEHLRTQHPSFSDGLIRHMSRHTRLLSEYFVSSTIDDLPCRVAMRLLKSQKSDLVRGLGTGLTVRLSQSEIALMVGASRQAVNRVLQRFQDHGLITLEYGRVQVHDVDGLKSAT